MTAGELRSLYRIFFWIVAKSKFDRIHIHCVGELVHSGFESKRADRFTGRTHESIGYCIEARYSLPYKVVLDRV